MGSSEGAAVRVLSLFIKVCKTFVKGSSVQRPRLQSYACLNISNMVSNMANMTTSLCTSQPLFKVIPLDLAIFCLVEHKKFK